MGNMYTTKTINKVIKMGNMHTTKTINYKDGQHAHHQNN